MWWWEEMGYNGRQCQRCGKSGQRFTPVGRIGPARATRGKEGPDMAIVGTHERSLDDKGRLVLPARFRSHFSGVVYLSPGDGCISLWPSERFDLMVASVEEKIRSGELEPNVRRGVSSGSVEVSPDAQGRVMLPEKLRAFARLEHEVVVCGAIDRIEIWNPITWADMAPDLDRLVAEAMGITGGI